MRLETRFYKSCSPSWSWTSESWSWSWNPLVSVSVLVLGPGTTPHTRDSDEIQLDHVKHGMIFRCLLCATTGMLGFFACLDFFSLFVCHSPSELWTSSIGLVSLESRSRSWTSKSWSWNCWVFVLVLDKEVLNPSLTTTTITAVVIAVVSSTK